MLSLELGRYLSNSLWQTTIGVVRVFPSYWRSHKANSGSYYAETFFTLLQSAFTFKSCTRQAISSLGLCSSVPPVWGAFEQTISVSRFHPTRAKPPSTTTIHCHRLNLGSTRVDIWYSCPETQLVARGGGGGYLSMFDSRRPYSRAVWPIWGCISGPTPLHQPCSQIPSPIPPARPPHSTYLPTFSSYLELIATRDKLGFR